MLFVHSRHQVTLVARDFKTPVHISEVNKHEIWDAAVAFVCCKPLVSLLLCHSSLETCDFAYHRST